MDKELENMAYNERPDYEKIQRYAHFLRDEIFLSQIIGAFDIYLSSLNGRRLSYEESENLRWINENLAAFLDMNEETLNLNRNLSIHLVGD